MRVALTRPRADSEQMVALLQAAGIETIISPVLEIIIDPPEDFSPVAYQAILLTSRNGAEALAKSTVLRNLRILAVGEATAGRAKRLGFADLESAGGDAEALIKLAVNRLTPADGPLLHARGRESRGNLSARLSEHGFAIDSVVLYRAEPVANLEAEMQRALAAGRLDGVLAFSPRSLGRFSDLVAAAGLAESLGSVVLYAMSDAVADAAAGLAWASVVIAAEPTQEALLAMVAAAAEADTGASQMTSTKDKTEDPEPAADGDPPWDNKPADTGPADPAAEDGPIIVSDDSGLDQPAALAAAGYAADPEIPDAPLRDPAADQPARRRWPYILAALVLVFVGGLVAWPLAMPGVASFLPQSVAEQLTGSAFGDRLGEIERRLEALAARISASQSADSDRQATTAATRKRWDVRLETLETGLAQGNPARAGLGDRIDNTEARIDQLTARLDTASDEPEISERLAQLTDRLAALEAAPSSPASGAIGGSGPSAAEIRRLTARLAKLEKVIADNAADGAAAGAADRDALAQLAGLDADIGGLKQSLADLSTGAAAQAALLAKLEAGALAGQGEARNAGLAVALSQLRVASRGAAPFAEELATVKAFGADDPELDALAAPAASGVATLGDLRARFAAIAADIVTAARLPADDSWASRTLARLGQMVRVRRTGEVTGDGVDAIVARIELRLGAGDLVAAVGEVKGLDGAAAERAAAWLSAAEARLAVDRTTAELQARLLAALGGDN